MNLIKTNKKAFYLLERCITNLIDYFNQLLQTLLQQNLTTQAVVIT